MEFDDSYFNSHTVTIKNDVGRRINDVTAAFSYSQSFSEFNADVSSNATPDGTHSLNRVDESTVEIGVPLLRIGETVSITSFARSAEPLSLEISVYSDDYVGTLEQAQVSFELDFNKVLAGAGVAVYLAFVLFGAWKFGPQLELIAFRRHVPRRNDTAFALLHNGQGSLAEEILRRQLLEDGGGVYELSNLAVCHAMREDLSDAENLLGAARAFADEESTGQLLASEAIILSKGNDSEAALEKLREFENDHADQYKFYLEHSALLRGLVQDLALE